MWRIWNFHTWLDPSYIHVQHISKGSSFIYNSIYMYLYIPERNKIFILFFASVCFCLSSLGALRIQAYLYGAWQRQLRIASEFTEGELLPLVSTLYNHNVCIAEIVNLVFMKLFFPFLLGVGGVRSYFPCTVDHSKLHSHLHVFHRYVIFTVH